MGQIFKILDPIFRAPRLVFILSYLILPNLFASKALAQSGPTYLNIAGALYDNTGTAITGSVDFRLQIYNAAGTCLMYQEDHTQDLTNTKGGFSFDIGKGSNIVNNVSGGASLTRSVFENNGNTAVTGCGTVNLASGDDRLVRISYDNGGGLTAMTPDVPIGSTAYAMVAETLSGFGASSFLKVRDDGSTDLSQSNIENIFSSTNYTRLNALVNGSSTQYMVTNPSAAVSFNNQRITSVADPTAATDVANKQYADGFVGGKTADVTGVSGAAGNGHTLIWDQAQNKWTTGVASAVDNTKLPLNGGTMAGDINMDSHNITNVGYMSLVANRYLQMSNMDDTGEGNLIATPLNAGHKGAVWYNTSDDVLKVWTGAAARQIAHVDGTGHIPSSLIDNSAFIQNGNSFGADAVLGTSDNFALQFKTNNNVRAAITNAGQIGLGTATPTAGAAVDVYGAGATSAMMIPRDTTANRPAGVNGMIRYNSQSNKFEAYENGAWVDMIGGGGGAGDLVNGGNAGAVVVGSNDNTLSLEANDSVAMTIVATGNVGVGTATPSTGALTEFYGTGAANSSIIIPRDTTANRPAVGVPGMMRYNSTTNKFEAFEGTDWVDMIGSGGGSGDLLNGGNAGAVVVGSNDDTLSFEANNSVAMTILANGNVGVGTVTPAAPLHVERADSDTEIQIVNSSSTSAKHPALWIKNYTGGNGGQPAINTLASRGTKASPEAIEAGDALAVWSVGGQSGTGANDYTWSASIGFVADGNFSGSTAPSSMTVSTSGNERMRINSSGQMGLGTASPSTGALAEFYGTGAANSSIIIPRDTTGNRPVAGVNGMMRYNSTSNKFEAYENGAWVDMIGSGGGGSGDLLNGGNAGAVVVGSNDNTLSLEANNAVAMTILANGNVGIGTNNPINKLDIDGGGNDIVGRILSGDATKWAGYRIGRTGSEASMVVAVGADSWATGTVAGDFAIRTEGSKKIVFNTNTGTGTSILTLAANNAGVGIGTATPTAGTLLDVRGTGSSSSMIIPRDSTNNRPTGVNGMMRYNSTSNKFEAYENGAWVDMIGSGGASQWTTVAGNEIHYSTANVGIGTNDPDTNLHVYGSPEASLQVQGGNTIGYLWSEDGVATHVGTVSNHPLGLVTNDSVRMTITNSGFVGIGTATPTTGALVDFYGTGATGSSIVVPRDSTTNRPVAGVNGMMRYNSTSNKFEAYENGAWVDMIGGGGSGDVVNGGNTVSATMVVGTESNHDFALETNATTRLTISNGGNVSIGTTSSVNKLHVYDATTSTISLGRAGTPASIAKWDYSSGGVVTFGAVGDDELQLVTDDTARLTINDVGRIGIGTATVTAGAITEFYGTGNTASSIIIPRDSTTNRPTGVNGMMRYNSTTHKFEGYQNGAWTDMIGAGGGGDFMANGSVPMTGNLTMNGNAARSIIMADHTTASSDGNDLLIQAGGSGSNLGKSGGDLILSSGKSTQGGSDIEFRVSPYDGGTTPETVMNIWANADTGTAAAFTLSPGTSRGMSFEYDNGHMVNVSSGNSDFGMEYNIGEGGYAVNLGGSSGDFIINGSSNNVFTAKRAGSVGIGTATPTTGTRLDISGTTSANSAIIIPRAATTARPAAGVNGMMRYNSTSNKFEAYENGAWVDMIGSGGGGDLANGGNDGAVVVGSNNNTLSLEANNATAMTILANGNVGIGTVTPDSPLKIQRDGASSENTLTLANNTAAQPGHGPGLEFEGEGGVTMGKVSAGWDGVFNNNANLSFSVLNNGVVQTPVYISYYGYMGLGDDAPNAKLEVVGDLMVSSTDVGNGDRFIINSSGQAGIGTATPTTGTLMDLHGTTAANSSIIIPRAATADRPATGVNGMMRYNSTSNKFEAYENGAWVDMIGSGGGGDLTNGGNAGAVVVGSNNSTLSLEANNNVAMTILANGNVGIATTTPSTTFHAPGILSTNMSGFWSLGLGNGADSQVENTIALTTGNNTSIGGWNSILIVQGNSALDAASNSVVAIGNHQVNTTTGTYSVLLGNNVSVNNAANAVVIGSGVHNINSAAGNLVNNQANSVWIGANSSSPSIVVSGGSGATASRVGIGTSTLTAGAQLDIAGTTNANSSIIIPRATTGNRPAAGVNGMMRYNSTTNKFEAYENGAWVDMIGAGGGGDLLNGGNNGAVVVGSNDNTLSFEANNAVAMTILATGSIGIGTTTPLDSAKLHIASGTGGTGARLALETNDTAIANNDELGSIDFRGLDSATRIGARIRAVADNTWGTNTNDAPTRLEFYADADGNTSELGNPAAYITTSGIGIGATTPGYGVYVEQTGESSIGISTDTGNYASLYFANNGGGNNWGIQRTTGMDLNFWNVDIGDLMTLKNEGRVGIGTTNPSAGSLLDVRGTTAANSSIIIPRATTATRPTGVNGMMRYNSTSNKFEAYENGAWVDMITASQFTTYIYRTDTYNPSLSYEANSANNSMWNSATLDGSAATLVIGGRNTATDFQNIYIGAVTNSTGYTPDLVIGQRNGLNSSVERIRINASGSVGIGTAVPGANLHVVGDVIAAPQVVIVADEKSSGTQGGGCSSGAWLTRTLNVVRANTITGASLATNQITLPAGTYEVDFHAPAKQVDNHQARIYDVTGAAALVIGSNAKTNDTDSTSNSSRVVGRFILGVTSAIRLEHRCETTNSTDGFGEAVGWGTEVYSFGKITRVQ